MVDSGLWSDPRPAAVMGGWRVCGCTAMQVMKMCVASLSGASLPSENPFTCPFLVGDPGRGELMALSSIHKSHQSNSRMRNAWRTVGDAVNGYRASSTVLEGSMNECR